MHFVKHSLILAMLAVLTGCGGSSSTAPSSSGGSETPAENTMVVSSVSPQSAIVGALTTFTLSGTNMSSKMQVSLPNCQNISALSGSTSRVTFTCTPQTESTSTLTVKNEAGSTLFSGDIKLQTTAPADDIIISSIEIPSVVTVGQIATFLIKGQNLPRTLQISLPQCANISQPEQSDTQIRVTCTPQAAGTQQLIVFNEIGTELRRGTVIMQNPAPTLTGSWRKTAANGCASTDSINGEAIAGARSKQPLFTFVEDKDPETQVRVRVRLLSNEGFAYTTPDCSDTPYITTGIASFAAIFNNISAVQQTSGLNYYYPVNTNYSSSDFSPSNATAIVFKDTDNFCLFTGTVTASNISQFIQNITDNTAGCFTRTNKTPFSQLPPAILLTQSKAELVERADGELLLNVLERLNQRGENRYALLGEAKSLRPEIGSNSSKTYDVLTQIVGFSNLTFNYIPQDEPAQDSNFNVKRLQQLNDLGSQSLLFLGKKQLDAFFGAKTLYARNNLGQTFSYQLRIDSDVNATKLAGILEEQGAQGCRFVDLRLQVTPANTYATVCVDGSVELGTFKYRYVEYPTSTRTDALTNLLEAQQKEGYYPIRVFGLGNNNPRILFEYNSRIGQGIQGMQYKVYSQALPTNRPELNSLLNDQGKLGWHLWSQINDPSGNHLATIFASLPFPHLPDGEPAVLDPR